MVNIVLRYRVCVGIVGIVAACYKFVKYHYRLFNGYRQFSGCLDATQVTAKIQGTYLGGFGYITGFKTDDRAYVYRHTVNVGLKILAPGFRCGFP